MTISLKHAKESLVADAGDTDVVQPSDWNDEHTLTQATSTILGRVTAGAGVTEELTAAQVRTLINVADGATADQDLSAYQLQPSEGAFANGDKTKLDGISAGATPDQDLSAYQLEPSEGAFANGDKTKLDGIEESADVTDEVNVGSSIHGATAKTTPVDADTVGLIDSAASNVLKKLTFANLWAWTLGKIQTATITLTNQLTITNSSAYFNALNITGTSAGAEGGPYFLFDRLSATPAGNDLGGVQVWRFNNSTPAMFNGCAVESVLVDPTASAEHTAFRFTTSYAGALINLAMTIYGGVQIGNPTGTDKGVGTINAAGDIYKNNSAYTNPDYVLEHYFTGRIDQFSNKEGASSYGGLMPLSKLKQHIETNLRLPGITDEPMGMFERGDLVLEKLEELTLYILELEARIKELESN